MSRKSLTINEPKDNFDSDSITTPDVVEDEPPLPEPSFIPYRAFINHVDGYNAKYITAYITDQIFGASKLNRGPDEGAGEEEEEEAPIKPQVMKIPEYNYQFIGTVSQKQGKKTEDILYIVDENTETFREDIIKCGFIIYDISQDPKEIPKALAALDIIEEELEEIKAVGPKTFGRFDEIKVFILISTVMTWALTKPLSRNDPDLPFSEVDYKKRRPHPNYKDHFACEREVMKRGQKYSDKLKTYVVCSGIPYGHEEQNFEYFFKMAWYGEEALPLFIPGNNRVPLIYIRDLAKVLHGLMENIPPKPQYILAVEQTPSTLRQIIKNLAKTMGNGKTVNVSSAEAFLYKDLNQEIFDRFTVNLAMEPVFIVENLQVQWTYEAPLPENMYKIIEEFKAARGLKPIKIVLHGPPASGKTTMAKQLCEHYGIRYVSVASMIEEYLSELKESLIKEELLPFEVEKKEILGEGEEEEVEEEEEDNTAAITEQIREIELLMERDDTFPDDIVIGIMRKYLAKNYCQSRGYVLDDYPRTIQQGLELFGQAGEAAGGEGGGEGGSSGDDLSKILPDLVVSLEATDEFLCERMWKLKEEEIHGTIYDEENMQRRLEEYREINTEDNTILNFFDELELDMWVIDVNEMNQEQLDPFNCLKVKLGSPIGFGLSAEELQELLDLEEAEQRLAAEKAALKEKQKEEQAIVDHKNKMEGWSETLQKLQMEEEKIVIAQSEPLRHYLMKFVFPTLTKGLIELAKTKPDDPVDFLAEFLFKQNPEGRIFDPSFTEHEEYLYSEFKRDIEAIIMTRPEFEQ